MFILDGALFLQSGGKFPEHSQSGQLNKLLLRYAEILTFSAMDFKIKEEPIENNMQGPYMDCVIKEEMDVDSTYSDGRVTVKQEPSEEYVEPISINTLKDRNEDSKPPKNPPIEQNTLYKCNICSERFPLLMEWKVHVRKHTGQWPFQCGICSESFSQISSLIGHVKTHNISKPQISKPFECKTCKKTFCREKSLERHMRSHKVFQCELCPKYYKRKYVFEVHLRSHTGEKPFTCDFCSKSFTQKCILKGHIRIHTGEKPFKCETCLMSFTQGPSLRFHSRIHKIEGPFACNFCNKLFYNKFSLSRHLRRHMARMEMA